MEPSEVAKLFKTHRRKLLARLRRLLRSSPAAVDDALQDGFVRVLKPHEQAPSHPERFLSWHVECAGLDLLRRDKKRNSREVPQSASLTDDEPQDIPDHRTPDLDLEKREQLRVINQALSELPDRCRMAVKYVVIDELDHAEAAAALGVHPGSIGRYLRRAAKHCKDALERHEKRCEKGAHK